MKVLLVAGLVAKQSSFAKNLAEKLREKGYEVQLLFHPRYVLASDLSMFHLIIADYDMPFMNGIELIKKVKEKNPKIKFIILIDGFDNNLVIIDKGGEYLSDIENYINKM